MHVRFRHQLEYLAISRMQASLLEMYLFPLADRSGLVADVALYTLVHLSHPAWKVQPSYPSLQLQLFCTARRVYQQERQPFECLDRCVTPILQDVNINDLPPQRLGGTATSPRTISFYRSIRSSLIAESDLPPLSSSCKPFRISL